VQRRPEQRDPQLMRGSPALGEVSLRAAAGCVCRPARGHDGIRLALQAGRLPGSRGDGAVAAPLAGQFGVAAGENWRGSGHTRVHAMPAAWACDPGMTHDRNGG
jgi:hypothetical protein